MSEDFEKFQQLSNTIDRLAKRASKQATKVEYQLQTVNANVDIQRYAGEVSDSIDRLSSNVMQLVILAARSFESGMKQVTDAVKDSHDDVLRQLDGLTELMDDDHTDVQQALKNIQQQIDELNEQISPPVIESLRDAAKYIYLNARMSDGTHINGKTITIDRIQTILSCYEKLRSQQ